MCPTENMYVIEEHVLLPSVASGSGLFGKIVLGALGLLLVPEFYDNCRLGRFSFFFKPSEYLRIVSDWNFSLNPYPQIALLVSGCSWHCVR
jgi:hypothetical protein